MSESLTQTAPAGGLGAFEKWLSLWIAGAMISGTVLGFLWPELFATLAALEVASVNFVVAGLIWAMVFPMMVASTSARSAGSATGRRGWSSPWS
jgi:ACR3 family arsenite transporter